MPTSKPRKAARARPTHGDDRLAESRLDPRSDFDSYHSNAGGEANQIYGLTPVLEALRAGNKRLEQITIAEGARHERLRELLELAKQARVPVHRAPR